MNILISNDDGYLAPGIAILARVAAEFANVRVVAPERDRSGVSNSLTLDRPLQIKEALKRLLLCQRNANRLHPCRTTRPIRFQTRFGLIRNKQWRQHGR